MYMYVLVSVLVEVTGTIMEGQGRRRLDPQQALRYLTFYLSSNEPRQADKVRFRVPLCRCWSRPSIITFSLFTLEHEYEYHEYHEYHKYHTLRSPIMCDYMMALTVVGSQ